MAGLRLHRPVGTLLLFPGLILAGFLLEQFWLAPRAAARLPGEVVSYWEEHVARNERSAASRVRLGLAYEAVRRIDDARRAYEAALELDPDSEAATIGRYGILRGKNQRELALADLERYARDHPGCAVCWHNLVVGHLEQDRLDAAEAALERLFASDLTAMSGMYGATDLRCEAFLIAGRVYAARGDHERAVAYFHDATSRDPRDPRGPLHAARSLLALERPAEATEALDEAEALLSPGQASLRSEVTRLRRLTGRRARAALTPAVRDVP